MKKNLASTLVASAFALTVLFGAVPVMAQQSGSPAMAPQGGASAAQQGSTTGAQTAANAAAAQNLSNNWGTATTMGQNYDFGNGYSTSTSKLPGQVQTSITLGKSAALSMANMALGIF